MELQKGLWTGKNAFNRLPSRFSCPFIAAIAIGSPSPVSTERRHRTRVSRGEPLLAGRAATKPLLLCHEVWLRGIQDVGDGQAAPRTGDGLCMKRWRRRFAGRRCLVSSGIRRFSGIWIVWVIFRIPFWSEASRLWRKRCM